MSDTKNPDVGSAAAAAAAVVGAGFAAAGLAGYIAVSNIEDESTKDIKDSKQEQVASIDFEKANSSSNEDGLANAVDNALEAGNSGHVIVSEDDCGNCTYDFVPEHQIEPSPQ